MEYVKKLEYIIFNEHFWLPTNYTWEVLDNKNSPVRIPQARDLWMVFPMAVVIMLIRYMVETCLLRPLARSYGLRNRTYHQPEHNRELTKFYRQQTRPTYEEIEQLAKDLDWSVRKVQKWFFYKRNQKNSGRLDKFAEGGWRGMFRATMFVYGLVSLHDEPHFANSRQALDENIWPHYDLSDKIYYYYIIEMGWYVALLLTMRRDISRRDTLEHIIHHCVTIPLMYYSYILNLVHIGTLVLITLDAAEPWLEMAKMARHMNYSLSSKRLYVCFFIAWIVSRLYVYPSIVYTCYSRYFEWSSENGHCIAFMFIMAFMTMLSLVHVSWAKSVTVVTYHVWTRGDTQKELVTSESETDEELRDCIKNSGLKKRS